MAPESTSEPVTLTSEAVASLGSEARAHWRMTGEIPSDDSPTPKAASSPAEPDAPAAEIAANTLADSEPAPSSKTRGNAQTRKPELEAEIGDLLKRRHQLLTEVQTLESKRTAPPETTAAADAKRAESSPAADGKPPAQLLTSPDISRPALDEDKFFEAYPNATLGQFTRYQSRYELLAYQAERDQQASRSAAHSRYQDHYTKAQEADPDLPSKLPVEFLNASPIITASAGPLNFVAREIQDSEHGPALLGYLGAHPEEFTRLSRLPDAASVIREMARLESRVSTSTSPVTDNRAKPRVSSAPDPTTSVGRRSAAPADPIAAAVADGNTRRYMDEANRRDLERRGAR